MTDLVRSLMRKAVYLRNIGYILAYIALGLFSIRELNPFFVILPAIAIPIQLVGLGRPLDPEAQVREGGRLHHLQYWVEAIGAILGLIVLAVAAGVVPYATWIILPVMAIGAGSWVLAIGTWHAAWRT